MVQKWSKNGPKMVQKWRSVGQPDINLFSRPTFSINETTNGNNQLDKSNTDKEISTGGQDAKNNLQSDFVLASEIPSIKVERF